MLKVVFKNLEPSELAKNYVLDRIEPIVEKFPLLHGHKITLTLEMENSPLQAGPDLFTVSTMVQGQTYKNLRIKKSSGSFYHATSELAESFRDLVRLETKRLKRINRQKLQNIGENYE